MININGPKPVTASVRCTPRNDYFVSIRTAGNIGFTATLELPVTITATVVSSPRVTTIKPVKSAVSESIPEQESAVGSFQAFPRAV